MKNSIVLVLIFFAQLALGQKAIQKTEEIRIFGEIKAEKVITFSDLTTYKIVKIKDVIITNHLGEKKGKATKMKAVLLKDILERVEFKTDTPKLLSEFYFVLSASDGYKIVFSWNEIFNTETGNHTYIVVEKEGKPISEMEDHILLITTTDFMTGRRYVKALSKIEVKRAE